MKTSRGFSLILLILIVGLSVFGVAYYTKMTRRESFFRDFGDYKTSKTKDLSEMCLTSEEYAEVDDPNALVLSIPFDVKDYSTKHWGIVPFCANLRSGSVHGGLDFELKANSKVFSPTDGKVTHTQVGKEEGSGEIISMTSGEYQLHYSGLTNLQVGAGDKVKRGDYIANVVRIPHGEYHIHLGVTRNKKEECPLKYMDEEFKEAFVQMFSQADYESQTDAQCACECEIFTPDWQ